MVIDHNIMVKHQYICLLSCPVWTVECFASKTHVLYTESIEKRFLPGFTDSFVLQMSLECCFELFVITQLELSINTQNNPIMTPFHFIPYTKKTD